jgi:serine/threonine protein kinase
VAAERPLTLAEALGVLRDAAEALRALHESGRRHGAVCAENLVIDEDGRTRLVRDAPTPPVLSPEQLVGQEGDARSDVYCLGVTVGELVADVETLPSPVERLLSSMTAERPSERYQSMDDVLTALEACELMTGVHACRPGQADDGPRNPRRSLLAVVVVVMGLVMLALALLVIFGPTPASTGDPPESHGELSDLTRRMTPIPKPATRP